MLKEIFKKWRSKGKCLPETETILVRGKLIRGGYLDKPEKIVNKFATTMSFNVVATPNKYYIGINYRQLGALARTCVIICDSYDTVLKWYNLATEMEVMEKVKDWDTFSAGKNVPLNFVFNYPSEDEQGDCTEEFNVYSENDAFILDLTPESEAIPELVEKPKKKNTAKKTETKKNTQSKPKATTKKTASKATSKKPSAKKAPEKAPASSDKKAPAKKAPSKSTNKPATKKAPAKKTTQAVKKPSTKKKV